MGWRLSTCCACKYLRLLISYQLFLPKLVCVFSAGNDQVCFEENTPSAHINQILHNSSTIRLLCYSIAMIHYVDAFYQLSLSTWNFIEADLTRQRVCNWISILYGLIFGQFYSDGLMAVIHPAVKIIINCLTE